MVHGRRGAPVGTLTSAVESKARRPNCFTNPDAARMVHSNVVADSATSSAIAPWQCETDATSTRVVSPCAA